VDLFHYDDSIFFFFFIDFIFSYIFFGQKHGLIISNPLPRKKNHHKGPSKLFFILFLLLFLLLLFLLLFMLV
jgi:hypothetical protein